MNKNTFSFTLTAPQQELLKQILAAGNYDPLSVPHTQIAMSTRDCVIALYKSGKCVIQGKGAADFVMFILEPQVILTAQMGYEDLLNPENIQPHMGVDESGKGDFFGPLVIAAAYVDEALAPAMREMNVRDSKRITSDSKALEMGSALRRLLGNRYAIVKIGPQAYNRLYSKMRSVNTILAWGHARAIENLLAALPDCPRAISDQFGSKSQVERALMQKGRKIKLVQRHKAESDLAVAAASILAREGFLRTLKDYETKHGQPFPKGASELVQAAAVQLITRTGNPQILIEVAKCHFKTADEVLGRVGKKRDVLGADGQAISKAAYSRPAPDTAAE
jgi:ribonuclease HIII